MKTGNRQTPARGGFRDKNNGRNEYGRRERAAGVLDPRSRLSGQKKVLEESRTREENHKGGGGGASS